MPSYRRWTADTKVDRNSVRHGRYTEQRELRGSTADGGGGAAGNRRHDKSNSQGTVRPMSRYPAISLHDVTKTYPGQAQPALDGVSLRIESGDFAFLTGPSGSGKSTLIRLCLRESKATTGQVRVLGTG